VSVARISTKAKRVGVANRLRRLDPVLLLATLALGTLGMLIAQTPSELIYLTVVSSVLLLGAASYLRMRELGRESRALEQTS
jgi:hypothetical protein